MTTTESNADLSPDDLTVADPNPAGGGLTSAPQTVTGERADLLHALAEHRYFLLHTVRDLTDEQAAMHPTDSELCLGGLIKHVAHGEDQWIDFILNGPAAMEASSTGGGDGGLSMEERMAAYLGRFQMQPGETLAGVLAEYAEVAARTDQVIRDLPDLDATQPLPTAPWFEPGATWSARRTLLHLLAEIAQHAGHADIIRESIDGAKTMG